MKTNNCFANETNCYTNYHPRACVSGSSVGAGGTFSLSKQHHRLNCRKKDMKVMGMFVNESVRQAAVFMLSIAAKIG